MDGKVEKKFTWKEYRKYPKLLFYLMGMLIYFLLQILFAWSISQFIEKILPAGSLSDSTHWIFLTLLLVLLLFGMQMIFMYFLPMKILLEKSILISQESIRSILKLPIPLFNQKGKGYYLNLITGSSMAMGDVYAQTILEKPAAILYALLILATVSMVNIFFVPVFLIYIPLAYFVLYRPSEKVADYLREHLEKQDRYYNEFKRIADDKREINIAKANDQFDARYRRISTTYLSFIKKYRFMLQLSQNLPRFLTTIFTLINLLVCAILFSANKISLGSILFIYQLMQYYNEPVSHIFEIHVFVKSQNVHRDRLLKLQEESHVEPEQGERLSLESDFCYSLENFALYPTAAKGKELFVCENIQIQDGELVVIHAENGAGKSLLLEQLSAYGDSKSSQGYLGRKYTREEISFLTYPLLFVSGNKEENLFGIVPNPELEKTLGVELIHDQINDRPLNLSLGEQKKLSLLRVLSDSNAKVILLDEPFENLDQEIRRGLVKYFEKIKGTRTILVIDHNHQLDDLADRILVIEDRHLKILKKKNL